MIMLPEGCVMHSLRLHYSITIGLSMVDRLTGFIP